MPWILAGPGEGPPHRALLLAEMKLPGEAVLEFHLTPLQDGKMELKQTARFLPAAWEA
jgi:hypothetical protein